MKQEHRIFTSPLFLIGLCLLLANDWIWKAQFHNELTGKLSDFAGLFIFPLFWAAFFPRFKKHIFVLTALVFIWWKSPYSQFFIEGWNVLVFFEVSRVVDYSDLWALLVLPFAYYFRPQSSFFEKKLLATRQWNTVVIALCSFGFMATSLAPKPKQMEIAYDETYHFDFPKEDLQGRIFDLYQDYSIGTYLKPPERIQYSDHEDLEEKEFIQKYLRDTSYLEFNTTYLVPLLMLPDRNIHVVKVIIEGDEQKSTLQLLFLEEYRSASMHKKKERYSKKLLRKFEKKVVKKLQKK
ncbi:MAG: hypothetical protein AB8B69_15280 [Chitinophagales bacterium]